MAQPKRTRRKPRSERARRAPRGAPAESQQGGDAVRASEERARRLAKFAEENPNPVVWVSADGEVLYANPAAAKQSSWRCEVGKPLGPEPLRQVTAEAVAARQGIERELKLGDADFWVAAAPRVDEGYTNLYGRDITSRKRAERALAESRRNLERAQEVGQMGWWRLDVRRNVLTWSDETHRIFGIPKGTPMTYETFLAAVHPDDRAHVDKQWQAGLRGEPYDVEHRIVRDGEVRWAREKAYLEFDDAGGLLGGFGITQDITGRKQAETALERAREELEERVAERTAELTQSLAQIQDEASRRELAESALRDRTQKLEQINQDLDRVVGQLRLEVGERLRAEADVQAERDRLFSVLNMMPGYTVLKDRGYVIRFASHGFLDVFSDTEGRPCYTVQYGLDAPCDDCPMPQVLDGGRPRDWEYVYDDGSTYHVWAYPFTDSDGEVLLLEFGVDVTEMRRLEQLVGEMSEAERRRIGRDLHDTLGQTMTGLGYLVGGLADRIAREAPEERQAAEQIAETINEATAQVRALARGLDPVGLEAEGLVAALRELAEQFEETHGLPCEFRGDTPVNLDAFTTTYLYRIAQEATNNAAKHSGADRIEMSLTREDDGVTLRVADDGCGLPDDLSRAAGMGLRIMRYRAGAIGARLQVRGAKGEGTIVTCVLPRQERVKHERAQR